MRSAAINLFPNEDKFLIVSEIDLLWNSIRCADWRAITLSRWSRDSMCRIRVDVRKFVVDPDVNVFFFLNALQGSILSKISGNPDYQDDESGNP